ncbi:MAG: class C sortase [Eubacterium sp.]|nr:class C sortase [Eubacterium sp.]
MKKRLSSIFIIIVFFAGLSLLLYPTVSDYINSLNHRNTISEYSNTVESLDIKDREKMLAAAIEYNKQLAAKGLSSLLQLSGDEWEKYYSLLNISGDGLMGYVDIPSIDVSLPIYHGTDETVLQIGVGHLEASSLPVGGESSHSVISGHRGLPSAKLFTNIDRLVEGNIFTIHVLGETFTYEVDQIEIVLPDEISSITIDKGQDYCTLITCTPYGINTHRLLVRGHRIENLPESTDNEVGSAQTYSKLVSPLILVGIVEIPVLLVIIMLTITKKRKK